MNAPAVLLRAAGFLALWLVLAGVSLADLPAAAVAVVLATWVSLSLSPPAGPGISLPDLGMLILRFPGQSLLAGIDVAMRVFDPRLPLNVDAIRYTPRLPEGPARDAFTAYASLMPGTVPVTANAGGDAGGDILIHCLDVTQPVAQQMAQEEDRFIRMLGYRDD
jgi:multicomponent Na+:H+ antiporter subunit E